MANNKNKKQNNSKTKKQNVSNKTKTKKTQTKNTKSTLQTTAKKGTKKTTKQPIKKESTKVKNTKQQIKEIKEEKVITKAPTIETKKETTQKPKANRYQKMYQNNKKNAKKGTNKKNNLNKTIKIDIEKINEELNKQEALQQEQIKKEQIVPKKKIKYISLLEYIKIQIKKRRPKNLNPRLVKQMEKERRTQEYKLSLLLSQIEQEEKRLEEPKKPLKDYSKSNIFVRTCVTIYRNLHIVFNSIILITFILLILGLVLPGVYETKTIIFYCSLLLFLIIVAISQNKYISGKIFTLILTVGMIFAITNLNNTYDFINIMNTSKYTYKTYYVVAFDNNINRSIHSINNKKVGVIKEVESKTTKILNTKISNVTYLPYENEDLLFEDFYNQKFRALIVNDNQLKFLENNPKNNKKIKILHEFKAVTEK